MKLKDSGAYFGLRYYPFLSLREVVCFPLSSLGQ